jgi:arylsulfatase A-like enzyme
MKSFAFSFSPSLRQGAPPQTTPPCSVSTPTPWQSQGLQVLKAFATVYLLLTLTANARAAERPNILWLSTEDMSPNLGCYGDEQARTPHIDELAAEGIRYSNAFVPTPVCATCRSAIITGVYSASLGTHHMRSRVKIPAEIRCFPEYLRQAGYYCTNNEKQDYNFNTPAGTWDESSHQATWQNRPSQETPFFAVFNYTGTHESATRGDEPKYSQMISKLDGKLHDPANLKLPPYYPDTPKVRQHWARYYNVISSLDLWVAERLAELDQAGVADDTIVFFWSDHGAGLPSHKRWLYDRGLHVPLIVYVPEKWRHLAPCKPGEVRDQLVSLIDLGPTVLNLAGLKIPAYMQGQPFLGPNVPAPRSYLFAARDRMDETYDMSRSVRDGRFKYIRNYMPQRPYAQSNGYGDNSDIMREWRRLKAAGELNAAQAQFMSDSKPEVELYDTEADPHEVNNLAGDSQHAETLEKMSDELDAWMTEIRDLGVVPEGMLERAVPRNGPRYALFRGADGEARYAEFADAARQGKAPPALPSAERSEASNGDGIDDAVQVFDAEQTLSDPDATSQAKDEAFATLLEIFEHGDNRYDQIAAANVLDLHVEEGVQRERLTDAARRVMKHVRGVPRRDIGARSLRPWANRFLGHDPNDGLD